MNFKIMGIYKITNKYNDKFYIGSSKDINTRWKKHLSDLKNNKHHSFHLQSAWNKYGEESFVFDIIEIVTNVNSLHDREQDWITTTKCYDRKIGYNMSPFVNNSFSFNNVYSSYKEGNLVKTKGIDEILKMNLSNNEKIVYYVGRDLAVYPTNCIMINNNIPSFKDLEKLIGLTEKSIRVASKSLEDKKLIKLIQHGHKKAIYINPLFYSTGKTIDNDTIEMFSYDNKVEEYLNY